MQIQNKNTAIFDGRHGILNLFVLTVFLGLIIFYIVQINQLVSEQYKIDLLKKKLGGIMEEQYKLQTEKFRNDGAPQIAQFAKNAGMTEASGIVYIFEEKSIAKR